MAMDSVARIKEGDFSDEFDYFLKWQADFLRHIHGWLTQQQEDDFDEPCRTMYRDLTATKRSSWYLPVSKPLSAVLRHSKVKSLFRSTGSVR